MVPYGALIICISSIIIILLGLASSGGGIYLIVRHRQSTEDLEQFEGARQQINMMIRDITRYPALRVYDSPNMPTVNPFRELGLTTVIQQIGIGFLVFGAVLTVISITVLSRTLMKKRRFILVYIPAITALVLGEMVFIIIYQGFPGIVSKTVRYVALQGLDNAYIGLAGNHSVSMAWNLYMKEFNCCGIESYQDFNASKTFGDVWGEPFHTHTYLKRLDFPLVCCNAIDIHARPTRFKGPCHRRDFIHKRGCLSVFLDALYKYKTLIICFVVVTCLLQTIVGIAICYNHRSKSRLHPSNADN